MRVLLWLALAACTHGRAIRPPAPPASDDLTLYRDVSVVRQRVEVPGSLHVRVPDGVSAKDVLVLGANARVRAAGPGEIVVETEGRHSVLLSYTTAAVHWEAAYTLTASPARDRAVLAGALAIRNSSGVALHGNAHVVDAELGSARGSDSSAAPALRDLGTISLPPGESRVPLVAGAPRTMHAVLVYDPIGTKLDNPSPIPLRDAALGVNEPVSSRVSESFEIARDDRETRGLPGGPVRLVERDSGKLIGEARLFDAATRRSDVDTISVGTADGVTGKRERRELTDEESRRRLVEEFVIEIDNTRPRPVDVLVREHLYRGQTWAVAYQSVPDVHQDGAQAFTMRTRVPPRGQVKIMYVVVYTWGT